MWTLSQNAATHPRTTVTTKEKVFVDGSVQKETIVKTQPPDHALAERNAERMEAEFWARQQQLNVLWREDIQSKGVDPDKLEKDLIERP